jgi:GNAT superfamily N-acetyltransferase
MKVVFAQEKLATAYEDGKALFLAHWDEIGTTKEVMQYEPNLPAYAAMERLGMLRILTARDETGAMIGYFYAIIMPHLHYRASICSFCDIFFLDPTHRQGLLGYQLLREATKMLEGLGVVKSFIPTKIAHPTAGKLLERLGYHPHEVVYTKLLREA